jgi:hypothetical protein
VSPIYARLVHLATSILAIGWPEDGLTKSQAQNLYIGGIVVCAIAIIFVLRQFKTTGSRALWVGILVAMSGFMLWQYQEIGDCTGQCSCELLGREVAIRDENAFCPDN